MIRRHVLAALAAGIEAGNETAAHRALQRTDWAIRGLARRHLQRALFDAACAVAPAGFFVDLTGPEASRHVQRVAALLVAKRPVPHPRDGWRVFAAYHAMPVARAPRLPIATLAVLLAISSVVFALVPRRERARRFAPELVCSGPLLPARFSHGDAHLEVPRVTGAYQDGGIPLEDPALAKLFGQDLPSLLSRIHEERVSGRCDVRRRLEMARIAVSPAIARYGPALSDAWIEMIEGLDKWATGPVRALDYEWFLRLHPARARAVSEQLSAVGLGYRLEGHMTTEQGHARALIFPYRVEKVVLVRAGAGLQRVLDVRRIDAPRVPENLLGKHWKAFGDPVVMLEEIDWHVASALLPTLAREASFEAMAERHLHHDGSSIARVAGAAIRMELAAALGEDAAAASEIGALLAEKARVIPHRWFLILPDDFPIERWTSVGERPRVLQIEERLVALDARRIAARCHALVAASTRQHEAQHALDAKRPWLRLAPALLALLEKAASYGGAPHEGVARTNSELSAYTSEIANNLVTPQLTMWHLLRYATDGWGSAESYAAVVLAEGLARHLGIRSPGPVIHDGVVDRDRLAAILVPLARTDGDTLGAAARALWEELFGEPLVPLVHVRR